MNLGNLLLKAGFHSMLRIEGELRSEKKHRESWGSDLAKLVAEITNVSSKQPIFHRGIIEQQQGVLSLLIFEGCEKENLPMLLSKKFDSWENLERFLSEKTLFRRADFEMPANSQLDTDASAADQPSR